MLSFKPLLGKQRWNGNLVPRALFPGFGGGAGKAAGKAVPPPKPGKSARPRDEVDEMANHCEAYDGLPVLM